MIRAGTPSGPDVLSYDAAHKAVWSSLAAGDRQGLAEALLHFAASSDTPLIQAIAAASLVELGQGGRAEAMLRARATGASPVAPVVAGIAAACAAGRDPFSALAGQSDLGGGRSLSLLGMVHAILRSDDPKAIAASLEKMLAGIRPAVNVLPTPGYAAASVVANLFFPPHSLNLGGGGRFMHPFWVNVDLVALPGAGPRMRFDPDTRLPFDDGSIGFAYSSHCLEHLEDATVARLLGEMRRVLRAEGRLVLKLPDAEDAIRRWKDGDGAYFTENWGLETVTWTWPAHRVQDTLDNRFAMLFCGYWNEAMTRAGSPQELLSAGAFHGPPRVEPGELRAMVAEGSPHALSRALRARALELDPDARFNHQNAWSRAELAALLGRCGFAVVSMEPGEIIERSRAVPDIENYRTISLYAEARPASQRSATAEPAVGTLVNPPAAARPDVRIAAANASAWEPQTLPNLEPRVLRPGLIQLHRVLWEYHMDMVRRLRASQEPSGFLSYGYVRGQVPPRLLAPMERIFDNQPFLFELDDYRADGFHS